MQSGTVSLSGENSYTGTTLLSGGTLVLEGANRLAAGSALDLNGGTLELRDAGGADGQTFAALSLTANSIIELGGSSLTFDALGIVAAGKTLTIEEYLAASSPDYAFRLLGDFTANADFGRLLAGTTIDGHSVVEHFDGVYTDVTAVPEPANVALLLAGIGMIGVMSRRRMPPMRR